MEGKTFLPISTELQQLYDDIERKEFKLRVWSGYESGIAKRSLIEENAPWESIKCDSLVLPAEVCSRFTEWIQQYKDRQNNPFFSQDAFDTMGLELAKELKKNRCYGNIVEYGCPAYVQTIVSYQVRADYGASLWNDTWSSIDLEWIEEDLDGYMIEDIQVLQKRFTQWEEWHYRQLSEDIDRQAFDQEGEALAHELQKRLPKYCVVYYVK